MKTIENTISPLNKKLNNKFIKLQKEFNKLKIINVEKIFKLKININIEWDSGFESIDESDFDKKASKIEQEIENISKALCSEQNEKYKIFFSKLEKECKDFNLSAQELFLLISEGCIV